MNAVCPRRVLPFMQIKRIIHLEVQSKPMYLRTLLYALRQGVALDTPDPHATFSALGSGTQPDVEVGDTPSNFSTKAEACPCGGSVPDRLLDMYLSTEDSISLTSKVLDVYAAYVDEGEVGFQYMTLHTRV